MITTFCILCVCSWKAVQDENEEALGILPTALYSGDGAPPPPPHVEVSSHSSDQYSRSGSRLWNNSFVRT